MAQQAIRKMKRKQKAGNWLLKGLLVSVAVTVAAVVIFAVIIGLTDLPDSVIRIVNQVIKVGAVFAGVYATVPKGSDNAIRKGVVIGLVYMGVGVLLYALLSGQQLPWTAYLSDIAMGVAGGGIAGAIVAGMRRR